MTIDEMLVAFRQLAQQMGMQNVRAITDKQIVVLLNTSISDIVNQIVRENVGLSKDDGHTDMFKIGQTDALRTLQQSGTYNDVDTDAIDAGRIKVDISEPMLHLTDAYINYTKNEKFTYTSPVRVIDASYLANTLTDYVNRPTIKSPIAVYTNSTLNIYLGDKGVDSITEIEVVYNYIKCPVKVNAEPKVDCDLPENLHETVVKYAVDLYRRSVKGEFYSGNRNQGSQTNE